MKKAQASMELIVVVGLLVIILFSLIGLSITKQIELNKNERQLSQRKECSKLSYLILETYINGNGTTIQDKLSYNATLIPSLKLIESIDQESVFCTIPLNAIPSKTLNKGNIEIKNKGDFVDVSNT